MKSNDKHVLYDIEVSGTSRGYDQLVQIAAIRTNSEFEILDRIDLRCPRLQHVIPIGELEVGANSSTVLADSADLSHYALVREVARTFRAWSPASFIAHNGIAFDEIHLSAGLFQTLHDPFLTQARGNSRADSMLLARAVSILAPDAISIPVINGSKTFRLGELARANGVPLDPDGAHNARTDVDAMRSLMVLMKNRAPKVFEMVMAGWQPQAAPNLVRSLEYFRFSPVHSGANVSRICTAIASAPSDPNLLAVADLAFNPDELRRLDCGGLASAIKTSPRRIHLIRLNQCPVVSPVGVFPGEPKVGIAASVLADRAKRIREDQDFQRRIARAIDAQYPAVPSLELADPPYDSVCPDDQALREVFQSLPWEKRLDVVDLIGDTRLRTFGLRLIYAERPDLLTESDRRKMVDWQCDRILADVAAPWLFGPKALEKMTEMIKSTDPEVRRRLEQHVESVARIRSVAMQFPHGARPKKAS